MLLEMPLTILAIPMPRVEVSVKENFHYGLLKMSPLATCARFYFFFLKVTFRICDIVLLELDAPGCILASYLLRVELRKLCDLQKVPLLPSTLVFSSVKWEWNYLTALFKGLLPFLKERACYMFKTCYMFYIGKHVTEYLYIIRALIKIGSVSIAFVLFISQIRLLKADCAILV